jgi:hypothetical protein
MKTITLLHKTSVEQSTTSNFFPRIIREFDDDDEPMMWG